MRFPPNAVLLLALFPLIQTGLASEPAIRFGYQEGHSIPFVVKNSLKKEEKISGIVGEISTAIAKELGVEYEFQEIPRSRVDESLEKGWIDLNCYHNPGWTSRPEKFTWSRPLFPSHNVIILRKDLSASLTPTLNETSWGFQDIGTIRGYFYPELKAAFASGKLVRKDAGNGHQNVQKLKSRRIQSMIDGVILYNFFLKENILNADEYTAIPLESSKHDIMCAVSKKSKIQVDDLNAAIDRLKEKGSIEKILLQYKIEVSQR